MATSPFSQTKSDLLLSIARGFRNFQQNKRAGKVEDARIAGDELKRNLEIRRFQLQEANFKEQSKNATARLKLDTERSDLFKQQQQFSQNLATQTFEAGREDASATQQFRQQQLTRQRDQDALSSAQVSETSALAGRRFAQQQSTALDRLTLEQQKFGLKEREFEHEQTLSPKTNQTTLERDVRFLMSELNIGREEALNRLAPLPRAGAEGKQDFGLGRQAVLAGFAQLFEDSLSQVGKKRLKRDDLEARSNAASTILDDVARLAEGQGITRDEILATIATSNPELFRKHLQNLPSQTPQNVPALAPGQAPQALGPPAPAGQPSATPPVQDPTQDLTRVGSPTAQQLPQDIFPPGSPESQIDAQQQEVAKSGDALISDADFNDRIHQQDITHEQLSKIANPTQALEKAIGVGSVVRVKTKSGKDNIFIVEQLNGNQVFVRQISTGKRFTATRSQIRFQLSGDR